MDSTPVARRAPPRNRWAWKLGEVKGIGVFVHGSFLLLLLWVALTPWMRGLGLGAVASSVMLIVAIFATVVLHELSHALVAQRFGGRTREIMLLPIGGVARLEHIPERPQHELLVALAGPMVNFAIALLLFVLIRLTGGSVSSEGVARGAAAWLTSFMWINVSLAIFNLLPAFPMDGGRILRALLAMKLGRSRATRVAARLGQAMALVFGVFGFFVNPWLVLIAVFVWMGAASEYSMERLKNAIAGIPVREAMVTDFRTLQPDNTLGQAVHLTLTGFQQDFPVADTGRLVGVLTRDDVLKGLEQDGPNAAIASAMHREFETARPSEPLEEAYHRLERAHAHALMVMQDGEVVGILTPENVGERLL